MKILPLFFVKFLVNIRYELQFRIFFLLKPKPKNQKRLLIFGQGRSGSTLLEDLICSTGAYHKGGEVLNFNNMLFKPQSYSAKHRVIGLSRAFSRNFVCHVKITHIQDCGDDPKEFLQAMIDDNWDIIFLTRQNRFKQSISNLVAESRGRYYKVASDRDDKPIHVDTELMIQKIENRLKLAAIEEELVKNLNVIQVVYERDLQKSDFQQETINRIMESVGLPKQKVFTRYRKINERPFDTIVSNDKEIYTKLEEEGYDYFLRL